MPDVVLAMLGKKQPMGVALVKKVLDADKDAGLIHAPRLLQRAKTPKFEGTYINLRHDLAARCIHLMIDVLVDVV